MAPIPKSGMFYPNKIARSALLALDDVIGHNGLKSILNMAGLPELIERYPEENYDKQFDFADFSAINGALEDMFGPRGGRSLAQRVGRATFAGGMKNYGALAGVGDQAFQSLPLLIKLRIGLPVLARIFSTISDQHSSALETDAGFNFIIHACPVCWGRNTGKPACYLQSGLLSASLEWISGGMEISVNQVTARSCGQETCTFSISKEPVSIQDPAGE